MQAPAQPNSPSQSPSQSSALCRTNFAFNDDSIIKRGYVINRYGIVEWGADNLLPAHLLDRASRSPQINSIILTQSGQVAGEGLLFSGQEAERAQEWAKTVGLDEELICRLAADAAMFGAVSLRVVASRAAMEGAAMELGSFRYGAVYHQRVAEVRAMAPTLTQHVAEYLTAPDWSVINSAGNPSGKHKSFKHYIPKSWAAFDAESNLATQLIYMFRYHPAMYFYPLPDVETAMIHAEAQERIVDYHNNNLKHGISSNMVIRFPFKSSGEPERDALEQKALVNAIQDNFQGNRNAGNPMILFYESDAEEVASIQQLQTDENGQKYIETNKLLERQTNVALGVVSPELYGMTSSSGFSSQADLLMAANDIQYSNKIRPLQALIIRAITQLLKAEGIVATVDMANSLPVVMRITPEMVTTNLFTANEFREMYGYPAQDEDMIIDEVPTSTVVDGPVPVAETNRRDIFSNLLKRLH